MFSWQGTEQEGSETLQATAAGADWPRAPMYVKLCQLTASFGPKNAASELQSKTQGCKQSCSFLSHGNSSTGARSSETPSGSTPKPPHMAVMAAGEGRLS